MTTDEVILLAFTFSIGLVLGAVAVMIAASYRINELEARLDPERDAR